MSEQRILRRLNEVINGADRQADDDENTLIAKVIDLKKSHERMREIAKQKNAGRKARYDY